MASFSVEPRVVRDEVERIVSGPVFEDEDRLQRFLRFVVAETLEGRGARLKESVIGVEVFGRSPDYDPKADPIVRVQARRLRAKLELHYRQVGESGLRIEIPKGGYVPLLVPPSPPPAVTPAAVAPSRKRIVVAVAGFVLFVIAIVFVFQTRKPATWTATPFTTYAGYQTTPVFSPDGMTVAFGWAGAEGTNRDIYVQRVDADSPQRITTSPAAEVSPAWLADGRQIGFLREADQGMAVVVAPLLSGGERTVTHLRGVTADDAPRIAFSADGRYLYASERLAAGAPSQIVQVDLASGAHSAMTKPPAGVPGDDEVALSPDGRRLAFRRRLESAIHDVLVIPVEGGSPQPVTRDGSGIVGLAWTRDSRALIVSSRRRSSLQSLWRFSLDGGDPALLTNAVAGASYPAVNGRDGSIAYASRYLDTDIWRVDLSGVEPARRVIQSNLLDSCPHYGPNGRRFTYRSNRTGNDELWVAGFDGDSPARLTSFGGPVTGNARWSPDGRQLAVDARVHGHADVFVLPSGGGSPRRLTEEASNEVLPSFSADGQSVYFASDRGGSWQIWKQPLGGGAAAQVTRAGGFAPVESSGWLYYSKMDVSGLFRMPVTGGDEQRVIERLPSSLWGGWALAGGSIVYLMPEGGTTVYVLDQAKRRKAGVLPRAPVLWDGALSVTPNGRYALVAGVERAGSEIHFLRER